MIGLHNRQTLLARIRPDQPYSAGLRQSMSNILDVGERLGAFKERLEQDTGLSDTGRRTKLVAEAKTTLAREFAKASEPVRRGLAHFKARRENLKPPEPNRNDAVGEMRRMEIRAHIASMPAEKRGSLAFELAAESPEAETAILDMPASLTGLQPDYHRKLAEARTERLFAGELAEIRGAEVDYQNAAAASAIVRGQLRDASGLLDHYFDEILSQLEAEPLVTKPAPQPAASPYKFDAIEFKATLDKRFDEIMARPSAEVN